MLRTSSGTTLIGYARVSNSDQSLDLQRDALYQAGCVNISEDVAKYNATMQRQGLVRLRSALRSGDTLIIWKLNRLSDSITELLQFINELGYKNIAFKSLCENIELSSNDSCEFMTVFNAIRPHVNENLEGNGWRKLIAKRARGKMGKQKNILNFEIKQEIQSFLKHSLIPIAAIAERYKISRAAIYNTLVQGAIATETQNSGQI